MTMYLDHFGLREAPFKITPHTEFFFSGANRGETLEALIYAITSGEGIVKVTGEVGAGKTMLCRVLMERLPKSVETIYFAVPSLSPDELLATIANDLGVSTEGINITKLIRARQGRLIEIHSSGKRVVALIDEAHAMPVETLDQIRLLSNLETSHEKLIQIVLFGQPELDQHLSMPNIRQLKERITHGFNLLPLPAQDIKDYLNFRLRAAGYHGPDLFSKDALKLISEASEGLTRRINIYADKTLLAAYAAGTHTITTDHVRAAITDTQIVLPGARGERNKFLIGVVTSLVLGTVIGFFVGRYSAPTTPAAEMSIVAAPAASAKNSEPPSREITKSAEPAVALAAKTAEEPPAPAKGNGADPATAAIVAEPAATPPKIAKMPAALPLAPPKIAAASAAPTPAKPPTSTGEPDWLDKRLLADAAKIAAIAKDRYAIQLMNADQRALSAIEAYLRTATR
ncbi:MAG: AAA family ATPase, partial [Usitatibacteraceae bacterium]